VTLLIAWFLSYYFLYHAHDRLFDLLEALTDWSKNE
jgi:hypothetical protein